MTNHQSSPNGIQVSVSSEAVKSLYTDIVFLDITPLGITLNFGQQMPAAQRVEIVARLSISPQYAKILTKILAENIQHYENRYGKIKITEDMLKQSNPHIATKETQHG